MATQLLMGAAALYGIERTRAEIEQLVRHTAGSHDLRWRHVFEADTALDRLAALGLVKPFLRISDSAGALKKCGSAWAARARELGTSIKGKDECIQFLTAHLDDLLVNLRREVRRYNRTALVVAALETFQSALQEQRHWRRTARALRAIFGVQSDAKVSFKMANLANGVIRGSTILIELGSADAPQQGGLAAGPMDVDELQAQAMLYFHGVDTIAAMHGDRIEPRLNISPTGDVLYDHTFEELTLQKSTEQKHQSEREIASTEYVTRFEDSLASPKVDEAFLKAIRAEYGVDAGIVVDLPIAAVTVAIRRETGVLVLRRSELIASLEADGPLKNKELALVIDRMTLPSRASWDDVPANCIKADFDLAKFDRRFSLIGRPIVALAEGEDPELAIAPAILERAVEHHLQGAYSGSLQNAFWTNPTMRTFASMRGQREGMEFNDRVANEITALGLRAWPSVKPTWCLNQKATNELKALGDIDVLAVSPDGKTIWVIEAKDLKLCRTRGEAARRLSGYRGQMTEKGKPDNMLRHLRRVEYIRRHSGTLPARLDLTKSPDKVCGIVIVNAPQPMEQFHGEQCVDGRVMMLSDVRKVPWSEGWESGA